MTAVTFLWGKLMLVYYKYGRKVLYEEELNEKQAVCTKICAKQ